MVAKRRKRSRKIVSKVLFLLLAIAAVIVGYFVWDGYFREKEAPKEEDNVVAVPDQDEEETEVAEMTEPEEKVEKEKLEQFDGDNPNEKNTLTGAITYAGVSGEFLMIRVNIDQYLSSGRCNLSLMKDGVAIFGDTVAIVDAAATSTCEGFNVPLQDLGGGRLEIIINLSAGEKTGVISGEVEI